MSVLREPLGQFASILADASQFRRKINAVYQDAQETILSNKVDSLKTRNVKSGTKLRTYLHLRMSDRF